MTPEISVVIPVFNEAGNIGAVCRELSAVLAKVPYAWELLVVDDGSDDGTAAELDDVAKELPSLRVQRFPERRGQGVALLAALAKVRGRWIVTLDGDGENDPHDIPALLGAVERGDCDMMCGWRTKRADGLLRTVMSRVANAVRRRALRDGIHDGGCQLRVFRREVIAALRPIELVQSFLPALAIAAGFRVGEQPVRHRRRRYGRSKYGLRQLAWRPAIAMCRLRRDIRRQTTSGA